MTDPFVPAEPPVAEPEPAPDVPAEPPVAEPEPEPAPFVPDGQPGWLVAALTGLHERLVKLGG